MNIKGKETKDLLKVDRVTWTLRAWVLAKDKDRFVGPASLVKRIWDRRN